MLWRHGLQKYKNTCKLSKINSLILYFFIFAFLGWVLESLYSIYELGHFIKRGFLFGPICPIYGYGAIMLITFLNKYKKNSFKLFLYSIVIFSAFEYLVSFILDALFAAHWWDYTNDFFNLNGRISIFYSFVWGVIAILFINHIYPFLKSKIDIILDKIPYSFQIMLLRLIICIFIVDTFLSCIRYIL